ncbi:MAG TPA: hypothetical protein VFF65_02500 [Phycisphaerales bacterium]|nr:hypothetical protein [Phycisphaerales bacterium]
MSQITADHAHGGESFESHFGQIDLSASNTRTPAGWGGGLMVALLVLGVLCLAATAAYGFMAGENAEEAVRNAWLSYHVGVIVTIGLMLGCLGLVLMMRATQAGWVVTARRQMENVASVLPLSLLLLAPLVLSGHHVWHWMDPAEKAHMAPAKQDYLNTGFFWGRIAVYVLIWSLLGMRMYSLSRRQDVTGDKGLTVLAQRDSAWGLLAFGLTTAFAAFDLSMSLDYHWFSTMFGVYFFAGNMVGGVALVVLILCVLRGAGVLKGLITPEHFHDLGKLLLAFTIFWAYIGFSQYFLIWYANIPEETAWMVARGHGGWENVGKLMMFGHFILPFVILLFRKVKTTPALLAVFAVWQIAMCCVDVFWQVRPVLTIGHGIDPVASTHFTFAWVDVTGLMGPLLLMLGLVVWRIRSAPLIPLKDPRLAEALNHKNYV